MNRCKKTNGFIDSTWLAVGIALGAGLGVAFGNLAIGVSLGVAFGTIFGMRPCKRGADKDEKPE